MKNSIFNSLDETELKEGFNSVLHNANAHFQSAQILANNKLFGIAVSHLILATEEAVKAFHFWAKMLLPKEDIDITGVFSSHPTKHQSAVDIADFIAKLQLEYRAIATEQILQCPDFSEQQKNIVAKDKILVDLKFNELKSEKVRNWWRQANSIKNKGFYVDYKDENWVKPDDIDKKEYEKTYPITGQYIGFINLFKDIK